MLTPSFHISGADTMNLSGQTQTTNVSQVIEIVIRLGIISLIFGWCLWILSPFISLVVWGAIIAVAVYPLYAKLVDKLGNRRKLAVVILSLLGIAVLVLPVISLSSSTIETASSIGTKFIDSNASIPPPAESVKTWPLVGETAYEFWHQASEDLTTLINTHAAQLTGIGKRLLGFAASFGLALLQFIVSLFIAVVFLTSSDSINAGLEKLAQRLSGETGLNLLLLSEKTVRSVAVGVIGIAFIQAILAGIGMLIAGVPAAGLLAAVILVLVIAQLSPMLVLIPVIIYLFSGDSMAIAVLFLVWSVIVASSDMALKPLLLGRGVDAPVMIILLGAIGGMLVSGIVGLFTGAVILAVGYKLFQAWLKTDHDLDPQHPESASEHHADSRET